jgi:hypothetical protein
MITRNQRGWVIALAQLLPDSETAPPQPEDRYQPAPSPDGRVEVIRHDPKATDTLADEALVAIARLLGRQAAREWFHAQGAEHGT